MAFATIAVMVGLAVINAGIQYYQHRKSNQAEENDTPGLDDGVLPRVTESDPIPVVWGTVRLCGPNVVWWGDVNPNAGERFVGPTGGKVTVGMLRAHHVFCQGPVDEVISLYIEDREAEGDPSVYGGFPIELVDEPTLLEGVVGEWTFVGQQGIDYIPNRSTSWLYEVYLMGGYPTQEAPSTMKDQFGISTPGFRGVFGIWSHIRWNTEKNTILPISATVSRRHVRSFGDAQWNPDFVALGQDMNPAHIIRELLTDEQWGAGLPESRIDAASFEAAAETLADELFGLSGAWGRQEKYRDKIADVLRHIDGVLYEERTAGKYILRLVRRDYDIEDLDVLGPAQVNSVSKTRPTSFELVNDVTVKYSSRDVDRLRTVPARDTAAQSIRGIVSETITYPMIYDGELAAKVAARDLAALSNPVANVQIGVLPSVGKSIRPGDVFVLTYPSKGIQQMVVRVTSQEEPAGNSTDGTIKIQGVEDVFAFIDAISTPPGEIVFPTPLSPPLPAEQFGFELPLWLSYRALEETLPLVDIADVADSENGQAGLIARTEQSAIDWTLWVDDGTRDTGVDFAQEVVITLSETGYNVEQDLSASFAFDDEDALESNGLLIYLPGDEMTWIGDDQPGLAVASVSSSGIFFGWLDTVPPLSMPGTITGYVIGYTAGTGTPEIDRLYGVDSRLHPDATVKSLSALPRTTVSTLPPDSAPETDVTIALRANRPYPPGRIRVDGTADKPSTADGSINLEWASRSRLGTQRSQSGGSVAAPSNVDTVLNIYDLATHILLRAESINMSDEVYTYQNSDEQADRITASLDKELTDLIFEVSADQDGLASFTKNTRVYQRA